MRYLHLMLMVGCVTGCASFMHQIPSEEPHAVLIIKHSASDTGAVLRSVRIDGRKVLFPPWTERHYRVTPGDHTLAIEVERQETKDNPYYGAQSVVMLLGAVAMKSSGSSIQGGGPSRTYTVTSYSHVTNTFAVEAGRTYILEGPTFVPKTGSNP